MMAKSSDPTHNGQADHSVTSTRIITSNDSRLQGKQIELQFAAFSARALMTEAEVIQYLLSAEISPQNN